MSSDIDFEMNGVARFNSILDNGELIARLRYLYDNNKLTDRDEITILDTIQFLGGEINW